MIAKFVDVSGVKHIQVSIPVESPRLSSTGKTFIVGYASDQTALEIDGKTVKIMVQATIKNDNVAKASNNNDMAAMIAQAVAAAMAAKK